MTGAPRPAGYAMSSSTSPWTEQQKNVPAQTSRRAAGGGTTTRTTTTTTLARGGDNDDVDKVLAPRQQVNKAEENLWAIYHQLKAVLDSPAAVSRRRAHSVIFDDSGRLVDMTEILPNLFIGDEGAAKNTFFLKKIRVTHVLNAAEGVGPGFVDTDQNFYRVFGIQYKGLKLVDTGQTNISMYFGSVADFIGSALEAGGKVLVNCMMGMSRSSTCVLAYLMLKRDMPAAEALAEVRKRREVRPNDGFLRQLADLEARRRRDRLKGCCDQSSGCGTTAGTGRNCSPDRTTTPVVSAVPALPSRPDNASVAFHTKKSGDPARSKVSWKD